MRQIAIYRLLHGLVIVLAAWLLWTPAALGITLTDNGKPAATIVIRESAFKAEPATPKRAALGNIDGRVKLAALDLQSYLEKISGAKLPIISDATETRGAVVLVGTSLRTAMFQIPAGLTPQAEGKWL